MLRDHNWDWLWGFSVKIGTCSIIEVELWALIHGLRLAWLKGARKLGVEMDSLTVMNWINSIEEVDNKKCQLVKRVP